MLSQKKIAAQIPAKFRKQILEDNVIYKAVPVSGDVHMKILGIVFENYVYPQGEKIDWDNPCQLCLRNIHTQFKALEKFLVALEKESKLIDSI